MSYVRVRMCYYLLDIIRVSLHTCARAVTKVLHLHITFVDPLIATPHDRVMRFWPSDAFNVPVASQLHL